MILGTMAILGPAIDRWPIPHTIFGTLTIVLAFRCSSSRMTCGQDVTFIGALQLLSP
jgi:hypothetical protein